MPRIHRPAPVAAVLPSPPAAPPPAVDAPVASVSSFSPRPPPALPQPPAMTLVPRPPPEREVPGVGRLTIAQADQVLASARQAVNQVLSYGRFYGASVSTEALDAVAHAGALKALEGLGYRPSADPAEVLAQVGEWLDWARCPFTLG